MTRLRLSGTLFLGAAFAALVVYYAFYQPFTPGAVHRAIPAESSFSFYAESLNDLLQSPVCAQIDKTLGAGNTLRNLSENNRWFALAAPSEIVVADIPFQYTGRRRSWAAVSWVGWRSPWLRWKLDHVSDKKLRPLKSPLVWPVWRYESPDIARGMSLTFALTDNLFMACLSERPEDIVFLLEAYDRRTPGKTP